MVEEECLKLMNKTTENGFCPAKLDAAMIQLKIPAICWPPTPPNIYTNQTCPEHKLFGIGQIFKRKCLDNGTWDTYEFISCFDKDRDWHHKQIFNLWIIGYSVSLIPLIISVIIFMSFRSLRCTRIRIHIQLFVSFILNNILSIIRDKYVNRDFGEPDAILCDVIHLFLKYFLIANYMWMFCEGLYLHISLVLVFHRDEIAWTWCLLIGWGLPLILTIIYCSIRMYYMENTENCWIGDDGYAGLIIQITVAITLLASFVFLINVLRVILRVMHDNNTLDPRQKRVKKAARAALVLIPLLGLQFILTPFQPDNGSFVYLYIQVFITVSQGIFVSIIFCFANQDVHHAIINCYNRKIRTSRFNRYNYNGSRADSAAVSNGQHTQSIRLM